ESGPVSGLFTVSLTQASATDTLISYTVGGTAVSGSDFSPLSGSLTIPENQLSATIPVPVLDDTLVEGSETVSVTLSAITSGDPQIAVGAANSATLSIADNDTSTNVNEPPSIPVDVSLSFNAVENPTANGVRVAIT